MPPSRPTSRSPGRITMPVRQPIATRQTADITVNARSFGRFALLLLALSMFGHTFQYLIDVYPLYALSKFWPVLTLPFVVIGFRQADTPNKKLLLATWVWMWGVTPVIGVMQLGNSISDSIATTVKAWAFLFPVSAYGFLLWLKPTQTSLNRAIIVLGVLSFLGLTLVWILVPFSVYDAAGDNTKLYMYDDERGYHLFIPILFGLTTIFALNRAFWRRPRVWQPLALAACFAVMIMIYKERATLGGTVVIMAWGALDSVRSRMRGSVFAVAAVVGAIGAFALILHLQNAGLAHSNLGGSLSIRQNSVASALDYLSGDPLRWVFGVGSSSRVGEVSLQALLHNKMFYLDDIGWLGVVFEYGAIGATLIGLVHLAAFRQTRRAITPDNLIMQGLSDYMLYVLLVSPIYSVMFTPGEAFTCFAIATYVLHNRPAVAWRPAQINPRSGPTPGQAIPGRTIPGRTLTR